MACLEAAVVVPHPPRLKAMGIVPIVATVAVIAMKRSANALKTNKKARAMTDGRMDTKGVTLFFCRLDLAAPCLDHVSI